MGNIEFKQLPIYKIDSIRELWEALTHHHQAKSEHFKEHFATFTFESRKKALLKKAEEGQLLIDVAKINSGKLIAYCISSIDKEKTGEVDSLFVDEQFRKMKIGDELMKRALIWFENKEAISLKIIVAQGNEEVFNFYQKFGFYHRHSVLHSKKC